MSKQSYTVVGVMSGTSLDGIDLARLIFSIENGNCRFEILECETVAYPIAWLNKLKVAVDFSSKELTTLNLAYTEYLGFVIKKFIEKHCIVGLDAVCSHGHTILHQPQNGFTFQIGNLPEIADIVGETVVCDFRVQDVAFGGQGAPLVPIGDRLLFFGYDFCLNLGGFSNVSFELKDKRIAFDISPVNTVLNYYANRLGMDYDDKGQLARTGLVTSSLLEALNDLGYYQKPFPKSLGFEFVKEIVLPLMESYSISEADKMHTFIEHVAVQIGLALEDFTATATGYKLLITGGGAYNDYLLERMQVYLPKMELIVPNQKVLEYKEALIFGLLGVLKLRDEVNTLCSVTGATHDHSSGVIYLAKTT